MTLDSPLPMFAVRRRKKGHYHDSQLLCHLKKFVLPCKEYKNVLLHTSRDMMPNNKVNYQYLRGFATTCHKKRGTGNVS